MPQPGTKSFNWATIVEFPEFCLDPVNSVLIYKSLQGSFSINYKMVSKYSRLYTIDHFNVIVESRYNTVLTEVWVKPAA